jgi:hypothetical protein
MDTVGDTELRLGKKKMLEKITATFTTPNTPTARVSHANMSYTKGGPPAEAWLGKADQASNLNSSETTLTPHINRST